MWNPFRRAVANLAPNGIPDFMQIGATFPPTGNGRLTHTSQTGDTYAFNIVRNAASGAYDVFIETDVNYRGRDSSGHATHRLASPNGQPLRICFKEGKEPRDLRMAVALSLAWSERTSRYIRDGQSWS